MNKIQSHPVTIGEEIGQAIRNNPELRKRPAEMAEFLATHYDLYQHDAVQIALRVANEPRWTVFPTLSKMELIITQGCNLSCDYCFVGKQPSTILNLETGKEALQFLLQSSGRHEDVTVTFFGGEPLLAFQLIRKLVMYGNRIANEQQKRIVWRMTTNGTLFDEDKLRFCKEHELIFLLSIDGNKETQDAHRKTKEGGSSFDMLDSKFALMKKYQPWMGARITLMPDTVHLLLGNVKFLITKGINNFLIEPAEGVLWHNASKISYIDKMTELYLFYMRNKTNNKLKISTIDSLLNDIDDYKTFKRGCWAGKSSIAVAPDGTIYPCSKFISPTSPHSPFILGDVKNGFTENDVRQLMVQFPSRPECYNCEFVFGCTGGCPAVNFLAGGDQASTCIDECEKAKMKGSLQYAVKKTMFHHQHQIQD